MALRFPFGGIGFCLSDVCLIMLGPLSSQSGLTGLKITTIKNVMRAEECSLLLASPGK